MSLRNQSTEKRQCKMQLATNINPSGVHNLPHLNSPTTILSIPENSSNNSNQNSDGELLNIAGRSIFDHDKIH